MTKCQGLPTWEVEKRNKDLADRTFLNLLDQLILEKELNDYIVGPEAIEENRRVIIKVKCSRRTAKILLKALFVLKMTTTSVGLE